MAQQIQATLKSHRVVDVCSERKEALVSINIGRIYPQDQLFGYEYSVLIDKQHVVFKSGLTVNTLSEMFEYKNVGFRVYDNEVVGWAASLGSTPIFHPSNKPDMDLSAFLCNYIGDCPDTTYFAIKYLDPTDEFKKSINIDNAIVPIYAVVADKPERIFYLEGDKTEISDFGDDSTQTFLLSSDVYQDSRLEEAIFKISLDNGSKFSILSIESVNEKLDIKEIKNINNEWHVTALINGDINGANIFKITVKELEKNSFTDNLEVEVTGVNRCACVTRFNKVTAKIAGSKKDSVISNVFESEKDQDLKIWFDSMSNTVNCSSIKAIKSITLLDITGRIIRKKIVDAQIPRLELIDATNLPNGSYLVDLVLNDGTRKTKIVIKNF